MRLLVCGSRDWNDYESIAGELYGFISTHHVNPLDLTIVEGGAPGADSLARQWAKANGVAFDEFPADWATYAKAAGPLRNQQMLDSGVDHVLAFHPNIKISKGTKDMVNKAKRAGVPVEVITK